MGCIVGTINGDADIFVDVVRCLRNYSLNFPFWVEFRTQGLLSREGESL